MLFTAMSKHIFFYFVKYTRHLKKEDISLVSKFKNHPIWRHTDPKYRHKPCDQHTLTGTRSCCRAKCRLTGLLSKHRRLAAAGHGPKSRWCRLRTSRKQRCWRGQSSKACGIRLAGTLTLSKCRGLVNTKCWTGRWCWRSSAKYKGGS